MRTLIHQIQKPGIMRGLNDGTMSFDDFLLELVKAHGWKAALSLIFSWIGGQLLPVAGFILAGTALVAFDWITGMTASLMHKKPVTSRALFRTVMKLVFYPSAILLTKVVESTFFHTSFMIYTVAAYISLVELYSNLENISLITGTNVIGVIKKTMKVNLLGRKSLIDPDKNEEKPDK